MVILYLCHVWTVAPNLSSKNHSDMEGKLRELTDRIYQEGVERARKEAEQILTQAHTQAEQLRRQAELDAQRLRDSAAIEVAQLKENTLAELRLAAAQAKAELKQQISRLISARLLNEPLQQAVQDKKFLQDVIQIAVQHWRPDRDANPGLQLLLPEEARTQLEAYLSGQVRALLGKGLQVGYSTQLKDGFRIGPADGSYLVSFSSEDFERFFSLHLRAQVDKLLFDGQ